MSQATFSIITPEMAEKVLKILETGAGTLQQEASAFLSEVINYLIFAEVMNVLQNVFFMFILIPVIFKFFGAWEKSKKHEIEVAKEEHEERRKLLHPLPVSTLAADELSVHLTLIKSFKVVVISFCTFIALVISSSSVTSLGKIVFAPKLYLLEIVAKTIKGGGIPK